ncbi:DUF4376 domain-containing protein [Azospirillum sp. ST 5-10]|uniref:DUF4376 domain-containing protein n=1 Tax=unclassified Azospirillum TaxID=2630922 RepID=UPI003F4A67EF
MSNVYSRRGANPAPLPFAIRLSDGRLRTDPTTFTPAEIADAGYVAAPDPPDYDPATQHAPSWTGTAWALTDKTPEDLVAELAAAKAARKEALAEQRWTVECGGITVGGTRIATDDRSKLLLNGKYRVAEKSPDAGHRWKSEDGTELVLTSAQVIAIGDAVADHVQACFDRELDLIAAIDAATTVQAVAAVAIETGWP